MDFTTHDNYITSILPFVENYQNNYFQSNGIYFQGMKTHTLIPSVPTTPDLLNVSPSLKTTTWKQTKLNLSTLMPVSAAVDEYLASDGSRGWQLTFYTSDGVNYYKRSIGYGVEALARTLNWQLITLFTQ